MSDWQPGNRYMKWRNDRAKKVSKNIPQHKLDPYAKLWDRHKLIQKLFPSRLSFSLSCYEFEQVMKYELGEEPDKRQVVDTYLSEQTNMSKSQRDGASRMYGALSQDYDFPTDDENYAPGYQFGE